jgi:hypothetical protein
MLVEREVGDQPVHSTLFFFHLPEPAQVAHPRWAYFFFQA